MQRLDIETNIYNKMTGRRLLIQTLGWDYCDFSPSMWNKTHNSATKRWSKKVRRFLKKDLNYELLEYNISTSVQHLYER